jgi:peptide/nickel transport system ATP-binding protein/oligopeptide transport system ATP-binding protein
VNGNGREPILSIKDLTKYYPIHGGVFGGKMGDVRAVDGVTLSIAPGETLGLVGESGCGKSTLGRTVIRLEDPTAGEVFFEGRDMAHASRAELFQLRRDMQMIFQDPYSSLNPRMTVGEIVREPLVVHKRGARAQQLERVRSLLETVGMTGEMLDRYPHEFSGGQRQRIGIARALALEPRLVIADEPVSALDVSVQSQVLNLMLRLQRDMGLTYLFISHDLSVVEHVSDTIAVMYLGKIVEKGPAARIFERPAHPYTRALIAAIPQPEPQQRRTSPVVRGETPSPVSPPEGCPFHPRCPYAIEECRAGMPPLDAAPGSENAAGGEHVAACIRKHEI